MQLVPFPKSMPSILIKLEGITYGPEIIIENMVRPSARTWQMELWSGGR